tara:strand:- start:557 stop:1555 length:999 start_codon:yes stop_codon:yes gene_type:complete
VKEKYLFELGGENTELGKYEALELLKTEKYSPKLIFDNGNIIAIEVSKDIKKRIAQRFAMTRRISRIVCYYKEQNLEDILNNISEIEIGSKSFAIRVIDNISSEKEIAKKLGEKISPKNKIDLDKPDVKILYYSNVRSIVSIWHLDNETYYNKCLEHHVKYRPFFSPISIHPRIARSMVNLANCSLKNKIVDPFCGTGGILIEVSSMKMGAIGIDILDKMVDYSNGNLKHYNLEAKVRKGDVEEIQNCDFNAIVTDPPYGISTTTKGEGVDELMNRSMILFAQSLKPKQRLVMAVSKPELVKNEKFKIVNQFEWYIHKSLTRYILVMERINT